MRLILMDEAKRNITDWAKEEEVGAHGATTHLWEESWDDDDTTDDFSVQLKYVLYAIHVICR